MTQPKKNYLFGLHAISALLREHPQRCLQLFILTGRADQRLQEILKLAEKAGISVQHSSRAALDNFAEGAVHQGVVAEVAALAQYAEGDLESLLESLTVPPFLLLLDGVQDPHNLGACLRTANAAGVHAVIIPKDNSASLNATVHKVASGAAENTPVIPVTNLARTMRTLKERGIWLYGASDKAETTLFDANLAGPIAWVLGSEGMGLRALTQQTCDELLSIPMQGTVSSLNVSVAAGVCLFETLRQRMRTK